MSGWQYRFGIRLKEWGEVFGWAWLVRLELHIKDEALR